MERVFLAIIFARISLESSSGKPEPSLKFKPCYLYSNAVQGSSRRKVDCHRGHRFGSRGSCYNSDSTVGIKETFYSFSGSGTQGCPRISAICNKDSWKVPQFQWYIYTSFFFFLFLEYLYLVSLLGSLWARVIVEPLSLEEMEYVLQRKYPELSLKVPKFISMSFVIKELNSRHFSFAQSNQSGESRSCRR